MIVKTGRPRNLKPNEPWLPVRKVEAGIILSPSSSLKINYIINKDNIEDIKFERRNTNMRLNDKQKSVLKRGFRALAHLVVAGVATWLAGPEAADVIGAGEMQGLMLAGMMMLLQMADKSLRWGNDAGESPEESVWQLRKPELREAIPGEEKDMDHEG